MADKHQGLNPKPHLDGIPVFSRCCYGRSRIISIETHDDKVYDRHKCICGNEWLYRTGVTRKKNGKYVSPKLGPEWHEGGDRGIWARGRRGLTRLRQEA